MYYIRGFMVLAIHYSDVTWTSRCLKLRATRPFVQHIVQTIIIENIKTLHYLSFIGRIFQPHRFRNKRPGHGCCPCSLNEHYRHPIPRPSQVGRRNGVSIRSFKNIRSSSFANASLYNGPWYNKILLYIVIICLGFINFVLSSRLNTATP